MGIEIKDIVKAIKSLTNELKQIRKIMELWDEDPEVDDEADMDEYIL